MNPSALNRRCRWLFACVMSLCAIPGSALTVNQTVTPAYVREHPKAFSVKVKKGESGLLSFTIARTLPERRYLVARLVVRQEGKVVAESSTPSYARRDENLFFFSVAPERLAETEFELGESYLGGDAERPVPVPGTVNYQFRLREFVSDNLLTAR